MNILLADDELDFRQSTSDILLFHGHAVNEARDGAEAMQLLVICKFDLILLDLRMPKLNGLEVLVEARKAGLLNCPVIVLTGIQEEWAEGVAGADAILSKGHMEDLLPLIERVCGKGAIP